VLRIVVLLKLVPDVGELKFDPVKKTIIREGVRSMTNSFDRRAVEESLRIKEKHGAHITAITMGPPQAEDMLREAVALGVDEAILLSDRAFAGADTLATSYTLSVAVRKLGFDLIMGGKFSLDAETGQLIPELAELVGGNLATNVTMEQYMGDGVFSVTREVEDGTESLEVGIPAVMSVSEKINRVRPASSEGRERAKTFQITRWTASDLDGDSSRFGSSGSPTRVISLYDSSYGREPRVFDAAGGLREAVDSALDLAERLVSEKRAPPTPVRGPAARRSAWAVLLDGEQEARTALELLSKLRSLGMETTAFCLADGYDEAQLGRAGAHHVISAAVGSGGRTSASLSAIISRVILSSRPYAVLFPSTVRGREVAARVAASLSLGLTGDATDLVLDERGSLVQVKPAFGGNIMAEIISSTDPQLATVRPGVFDVLSFDDVHDTAAMSFDHLPTENVRLISRVRTLDPSLGDLDRAEAVLSAGYGVSSKEGFEQLREYASSVGMAIAASRKVVDEGWAPPQLQVGLTGRSIAPLLYLAVALSGTTNHTIGIRKARVVLAVNKDPFAPIFRNCDVGILGDYREVLPVMKERLKGLVSRLRSPTGSSEAPRVSL
jgi:electron transfer flavoprotein alpha subunit